MAIPHWEVNQEAWHTLKLGKNVMPGVWTVTYTLERELDIKKSGGSDGARFKDKGYKATEITLAGELVSQEDWALLQEILPTLHPKRKGAAREAFSIVHPATSVAGIQFVYVHKIDAPEIRSGKLFISLVCLEYVPKPKTVPKPKPPVSDSTRSVHDKPPLALAKFPGMTRPTPYNE
jgi:hypothetical protein